MKELIILYLIWELDKEKFIEATIIWYDIDHKEGRKENMEEILERTHYWEYIQNEMENSKYLYKRGA